MYHIVTVSPWPILGSCGALMLTLGSVMVFHSYKYGLSIMLFGIILIISIMFVWWRDVIRESTFLGYHTHEVVVGLKLGMILFTASEVMFFFSFFWAFFHSSLSPSVVLGSVWPPIGIETLDFSGIPLLNTIILLTSGVFVTLRHHALQSQHVNHNAISVTLDSENLDWSIKPSKRTPDDIMFSTVTFNKTGATSFPDVKYLKNLTNIQIMFGSLLFTILLAIEFTLWQGYEYYDSLFHISDSVYGSTLYMTTGFHGFHVFIGTIFLFTAFIRLFLNHFLSNHHFGFEAAIWYWHFVDVVWLFLYIFIYCWSTGYGV